MTDLERVPVDDVTHLRQWDTIFERESAVLSCEDWPVHWVWARYGAERTELTLSVGGAEVGSADGRLDLVNGHAVLRTFEALARAGEPTLTALASPVRIAMGWPVLSVVRRKSSRELHRALREGGEVALTLPASDTPSNVQAHVMPVLGTRGRAMGYVTAAHPGGEPLEPVTVWLVGGAEQPYQWRIARGQDADPLLIAGRAGITLDMTGADTSVADRAVLSSLTELMSGSA